MTIRQMTETDLPQLLAIEVATQPVPWNAEAFARCREANYPGWVLEQDDKIIGFVLISLGSGECHVLNLCIHPDFQHQGHGRNLFIFALTWAKKHGAVMVYLEVRKTNTAAISLYRNMNFKHIGERKNYYPTAKGSEDALIFVRDLGLEDEEDIEF